MSDDRKYKQRGYKEEEKGRPSRGPSSFGMPRSRVVTSYKETVRCDECGADLSTLFDVKADSRCPKCQAVLHSCRNCHDFDTSARFECASPIEKRVSGKRAANTCSFFKMRTISVKDIGSTGPTAADDARKALEDLFKK
jgi:hypothetical protein